MSNCKSASALLDYWKQVGSPNVVNAGSYPGAVQTAPDRMSPDSPCYRPRT